jgi:CPA2 family monovalent cation:H+ antiporter-2
MALVSDFTLVLLAAVVGGIGAHLARQPLIVGYLVAGVVIGPFTGGLTVSHPDAVEELAEIGVVLLLFSLGLEVSFRELTPVRAVAVGGGLLQVALSIAIGYGLATWFGWGAVPALWFGAAIALSSTMVVLKTLQAHGRIGTLSSRVMLGLLVVQDLAVVPMMIVLPELGSGSAEMWPVTLATGRALLLLATIVAVATRLVPPLLAMVARANSRELFVLATTAIALGVGLAAWAVGLSIAIGAFIAGLVVNESEYAHQALSDVMPLRDLFGMLFFVSVGMLLDPMVLWQQRSTLGIAVIAVAAAKAVIFAAVVAVFGYRRIVPLATAFTLFQVGEFAFVLARAGRAAGALSPDAYALILNTAVVTMALTPAVSGVAPFLYRLASRRRADEPPLVVNVAPGRLSNHVIVAGAGRVGRRAAEAIASMSLPVVVVEYDQRRFEQVRNTGVPAIYGDASQPAVLEAAGIARACAVLITLPSFPDVRGVVRLVREHRPDVPIVARADSLAAGGELSELGVDDIVSPEFEGAIEMTRQALTRFQIPADQIADVASAMRRGSYSR